jgi:hypothetical protein
MLPLMGEERGVASALKGRLADVFVPALVDGALEALSRRLGNRATIDDPVFGRASTLSSIDPLLTKSAERFRAAKMTYRHVGSTTGVDRDVSEGVLVAPGEKGEVSESPIAVVAERRRLREIELRLYYVVGATTPQRRVRSPLQAATEDVAMPQIVSHVLEAMRKGAIERVLAAFEEGSRWVDPSGRSHAKRDGSMAGFIASLGGRLELAPVGAADDGRTCCIEGIVTRQRPLHEPEPAALAFVRGDSGLLRELRLYYEP